jgi:hypothetical protein
MQISVNHCTKKQTIYTTPLSCHQVEIRGKVDVSLVLTFLYLCWTRTNHLEIIYRALLEKNSL